MRIAAASGWPIQIGRTWFESTVVHPTAAFADHV